MLRHIKSNVRLLDNKNLVDNIYSLGKLHKDQSDLNKYGDFKFFQHFFEEVYQEIEHRVPELSLMEITYLTKGLSNLRHHLSAEN
jgi:hypothetical protein